MFPDRSRSCGRPGRSSRRPWSCWSRPVSVSWPGDGAAIDPPWDCSSCSASPWSRSSPFCSISPNGSRSSGPRKSRRSPCSGMPRPAWRRATPSALPSRRPRQQLASEAIAPLADPATWSKLRERMNVVIQAISEPRPGHGTDLYDPLAHSPEKIQNLRGIVLASDGDWNEGQPPVQAAARLRMRGIPLFAVPVGSRTRLPDVELLSLDLPTFGVAGKSVRVPFTIESSLPREFSTTVTLRTSDGDEVSKEVRSGADGSNQ